MSLVRIHNFAISLDGFGAGEPQTAETPFGHAGERLHEWMFVTQFFRQMGGEPGGTTGVDDAFARGHEVNIGAEIMGANKFGPPGWHDDPDWKGWWGPNPPFHTPVIVLTHRERASVEMEGGTTYHFLNVSPAEARDAAREAAGWTYASAAGPPSSRTSSPQASSTTCISSRSRSCSAGGRGSGTGRRRSRTRTTSRRSRRPAA
ncbi:hypothetical protein AERO9AM_50558 [Aeromicrobium sp. 9AM]|nr:hypothetical protein AERO9AM_50558 [Aeromicrobium sp. 9AM]